MNSEKNEIDRLLFALLKARQSPASFLPGISWQQDLMRQIRHSIPLRRGNEKSDLFDLSALWKFAGLSFSFSVLLLSVQGLVQGAYSSSLYMGCYFYSDFTLFLKELIQ